MKAARGWDVSNNDSEPILRFDFFQLSFKPLKLLTWISSVLQEPPVKIVTSLHVNTNNMTFVTELERLSVVSPLKEDFLLVFRQPVGIDPAISKMVDLVVGSRFVEVLNIDWPSIMITLDRVNLNIGINKRVFDGLRNILCVLSNLFMRIVPDVVGRVVSGPCEEVNFEGVLIVSDVIEHILQGLMGNITFVISPLTG